MTQGASFEIRFRAGGRRRAGNPFNFNGRGSITFEQDFVVLRGSRYRTFRRSAPEEEQRVRMVDIVNACTDGKQVEFEIVGVKNDERVGFDVSSADEINRILSLLPARQTPAFATEMAESEVFHDRIDHWTPRTPMIYALLAVNILVYVLMLLDPSGGSPMADSAKLVRWGSNAGQLTLHGQWWRLVTSMFIHGGLLHISFNMFALWQAGRLVERMFGSARFIALYMIAGVCGSLASVAWNTHVNSVGASGAIFGIIGGLLAFIRRPDSGVPPTIVKDLRGSLGGFLLFNIAAGLVYPHTDNAAHIGGLVGGYIAGHLLARSLYVPHHH